MEVVILLRVQNSTHCSRTYIRSIFGVHTRILILNENIDALSAIRHVLAKEGCEVITATNWETAVKLVSNLDIDYVMLDARGEEAVALMQDASRLKRP